MSKKDSEVAALADTYIYSAGCPIFKAKADYNKKRDFVVIRFSQSNTRKGAPPVVGALTFRVHETTGSFDHVVNITGTEHMCADTAARCAITPPVRTHVGGRPRGLGCRAARFEFAYNSKQKKLRHRRALLDPDVNHEFRDLVVR